MFIGRFALLSFFCIAIAGYAQDPKAVHDPTRGLSAQQARPFSSEREMKDIEREQLAKYISVQGKLIRRQDMEALYATSRETYVFRRDLGMQEPMTLDQFLIKHTGVPASVLKKAEEGAKKASYYDPYAKKKRQVKLSGKKMEVDKVVELRGKLIRRFGPHEVILQVGDRYMGIIAENTIVEDKDGMVSLRVFKTVKARLTHKVRFGTENLSVPMYQDVTMNAKDFATFARRNYPFAGLKKMLDEKAVSPDVAQQLSRPWLKSSQSVNPKR